MTKQQFTKQCSEQLKGIYQMAAILCVSGENSEQKSEGFVTGLLQQDVDTPSGTKRVLGEELYEALQKFK